VSGTCKKILENGVWVNRDKTDGLTGTGGIRTGMVPVVRADLPAYNPQSLPKPVHRDHNTGRDAVANRYVPADYQGRNGPYNEFIELSKKNWSPTFKAFDRYRRYIW
jgi:hypothetical protein